MISRRTPTNVLRLIEILILCWPTAINRGTPIVFPDTRAYFVAGRAAVNKALLLFHSQPSDAGGSQLDTAIKQARAVRSVPYSLFTYISADLWSLWLAILIQAMMVAYVLNIAFRLLCPQRERHQATVFIIILALCSTVSWTASNAMPDIFTSIAVLAAILIMISWEQMPRRTRITLISLILISLVMHLTNPVIVLVVLVCGAGWRAGTRRFVLLWRDRTRYWVILSTIIVALLTILMISVIGFHQWTLTPNAPPFLLARSLDDGPGKLYLRDHCPSIGLDMCKHLDRIDVGDDDFIWHQNGVYSTVSLDEAALLRAEDKRIYLHAALEHPWMQITAIMANSVEQLMTFTLREYMIPSYGYADEDSQPDGFVEYIRPTEPIWQMALAVPEYLVVVASLLFSLWMWPNLITDDRGFLCMIIVALIADAIVCSFSIPSPRYEARVIWLLPMTALLFTDQLDRRLW